MLNNTINTSSRFFIYDYETFGIHPALDRPAQFAGIRTDSKFQPIEKQEMFWCKPPNDYLPDPKSVLITNITPQFTLHKGLTEPEFAHRISQIFNISNTCIVGYNNIRFDDEFSRHIFYRNFYDPYVWAYQKGNSRWDLLPILRAYYSLCPQNIQWPLNPKNKPSFRLQDLAQANNIKHHDAHNAMSDVYATLELAKLIQNTQPKLFQFLYNHRTKNQLKQIIDFNSTDPLIYITNIINNKFNHFINLIAPITWHPTNPNILIACNLYNKLDFILNLNIDTIYQKLMHHHTITIHDILTQLPLQLIRLNACPILLPINFLNEIYNSKNIYITDILNNRYNHTKQLKLIHTYLNNKYLQKINKLFTIITSYLHHHTISNKVHVDNKLYYGFFNNSDYKIIKTIRNTHKNQLGKIHVNCSDTRLTALFFYYRGRNFPNTLNYQEHNQWLNYRKKILLDQNYSKFYFEQLNALNLIYQNNIKKIKLIHSLRKYHKYLCETIL